MDQYVRQSIDGRRQAIFNAYEVGDEMKKKIDVVFVEIEKLGEKCGDVGEFEAKFAASPLNQRYLNLFTEIATSSTAKVVAPKVSMKGVGGMLSGGVAVGVAESAAEQAVRNVVPTRAAVHQAAYDEVRKVPVLGDAIDISQKASYAAHIGKLFRRKKKDE